MADSTHDGAHLTDDGFHEIQLSGKQLVFVFMLTTIVAVVIFLCGVQVGRNVRSDRVQANEPAETVATAAPPPAALTPAAAAASSGPPAAEPPAPAPEPDDELSYAKRLQSSEPAAHEKLAPAAAPAPPAKTAEAKPVVPDKPKTSAPRGAPAEATSAGRPGPWIVQLTALQDRNAAAAIARRLAGKGYPAFVLDPASGAPAIYRVQVGGYPDRDAADQAARRLEKDEQFKAYVRSR